MPSLSPKSQLSRYLEELRRLGLQASSPEENAEDLLTAEQELTDRINAKLGVSYDHRKVEKVTQLQHQLQLARIALGDELESGRMEADRFFTEINRKMKDVFGECEEILGKNDFERLFDANAREAAGLIDPGILLASQSRRLHG
jgi:hypothetical protein